MQLPNDKNTLFDWAEGIDAAVTICDTNAIVIYQNARSRATFARYGNVVGHDLLQYHPPRAQEMIRQMLASGQSNAYTISKNGQNKLIYQTPWRQGSEIGGLVEISIVLPADMPHYQR